MRIRPSDPAHREQVLVETRPHWRGLVRPGLVALVGALLAGLVAGLAEKWLPAADPRLDGSWALVVLVVGLVYLLSVVVWVAFPVLRWRGQILVVTDRRIVGRSGVFNRTGFDMPLSRVNAVRYRHSVSDRMFGTGTLIVESANGDEYEFHNVPRIARVHELMYHQVARSHGY